MNGRYILSIDGTGYFSSHEIHCDQCCQKNHRDGSVTYHHQMLGAVLVNPDFKEVIPFAPEPIKKQDGVKKNDCERNAVKRLLEDFRREHPHLKVIVVEDGLASNAPHIQLLKKLNMEFILGAKKDDHKFLFELTDDSPNTKHHTITENGVTHEFKFINNVSLNKSNQDTKINFIEYSETKEVREKTKNKGEFKIVKKTQNFSWVTNIELNEDNLMKIMRAGRARWKIENETFNTLKNQGYNFEHNFGHGYKNLSTIFANLMLLAFAIDQIQQLCCKLFQTALQKMKQKVRLWGYVRAKFRTFFIDSWEDLYMSLINHNDYIPKLTPINSS